MFFWSRTPNLLLTFRWRRFFFSHSYCVLWPNMRTLCVFECVRQIWGIYSTYRSRAVWAHVSVCGRDLTASAVRSYARKWLGSSCLCMCVRQAHYVSSTERRTIRTVLSGLFLFLIECLGFNSCGLHILRYTYDGAKFAYRSLLTITMVQYSLAFNACHSFERFNLDA